MPRAHRLLTRSSSAGVCSDKNRVSVCVCAISCRPAAAPLYVNSAYFMGRNPIIKNTSRVRRIDWQENETTLAKSFFRAPILLYIYSGGNSESAFLKLEKYKTRGRSLNEKECSSFFFFSSGRFFIESTAKWAQTQTSFSRRWQTKGRENFTRSTPAARAQWVSLHPLALHPPSLIAKRQSNKCLGWCCGCSGSTSISFRKNKSGKAL